MYFRLVMWQKPASNGRSIALICQMPLLSEVVDRSRYHFPRPASVGKTDRSLKLFARDRICWNTTSSLIQACYYHP